MINKKIWGFIIVCLIVNICFMALIDYVKLPFPAITGKTLDVFISEDLNYSDLPTLHKDGYEVSINNLCTGFVAIFLLASIVIVQKAFKLTKKNWKQIVIFLIASIPVLFVVNLLRLYIIFEYSTKGTVEYLHIFGWFFVSGCILLMWYIFENK
ncbi:MAG: archaeosortase/exosortase family protein [Candidatus ainarchaeum sp.]|nr:archaeosortase/exosortase family protein [Candidatus ainarchaeum sp.]